MDIADVVMLAEDQHYAMLARKETRLECAASELAAEYMDACSMPLITTVSTPGMPRKRAPFIEVWCDDISERRLAARAISILYRDAEGKKLLQEMAQQHGEFFCDEVAQ